MELIVINENKLKIIMSKADMTRYGLDENEFHLSVSNAKEILSKILLCSTVKTGFESISADDKILLQLYPERHGGCELYVTRLSVSNGDILEEDENMAQENYLLPQATNAYIKHEMEGTVCYSFDDLSSITSASRALMGYENEDNSSLYRGENGKYYVFIKNTAVENKKSPRLSVLSEFGELENAHSAFLSLCERGECICERNAISILAKI